MTKKKDKHKKGEATPSSPFSISRRWVIGLILGATVIAFGNSVFNEFAYDDNTQILRNPFIRSFSNIPQAMVTEAWFWRVQQDKDPNDLEKPTTPYYRPVFTIYIMVGWHLFGDSPAGWHLLSLLMHLLAVYLVFLVLERFTGDLRLSAIATLLFALHPLRSESVAWISGVTDLLLAITLLPSFYFYMRYREERKRKQMLASLGLFLLAAFTKEPAVCLPIFVFAYEICFTHAEEPLRARLKSAAAYSGTFLAIAALYFGMRFYSLRFLLADAHYHNYTGPQVLLTIPIVIWKYIGLLLWPVDLSLYHQTPIVTSLVSLRFLLPLAGLVALVILARPVWRIRVGRFAILWFVINLLPVLNLSAFDVNFMVQERYVYIPSIGFALLLAMGLSRIPLERLLPIANRRTAQIAVVVIVCILFTGKSFAQNEVWKDDLTLYSHGAEVASDQPMSHFILGHHYIKRGEPEKVVSELEQYVAMSPDNTVAITNLATAHLLVYEVTRDRSHVDRVIALCDQGLKIDPSAIALWDAEGHAYTYDTNLKNYEKALSYFGRALRLQPDNPLVNAHIGATYIKLGNYKLALTFLETARRTQPDLPDTYKFLAYAYTNEGRFQEAADSLSTYLTLQPNAVDADQERRQLETLKAKLKEPPAPAPPG